MIFDESTSFSINILNFFEKKTILEIKLYLKILKASFKFLKKKNKLVESIIGAEDR